MATQTHQSHSGSFVEPGLKSYKTSNGGAGHQLWFEIEDVDDRDPNDDSTTRVQAHSTSLTNNDEWRHVAGQRRAAALNIYIDGAVETAQHRGGRIGAGCTQMPKAHSSAAKQKKNDKPWNNRSRLGKID